MVFMSFDGEVGEGLGAAWEDSRGVWRSPAGSVWGSEPLKEPSICQAKLVHISPSSS